MGCGTAITPGRTIAGDAMVIREAVKNELGIPVLVQDWENYDPRVFNYKEYRSKLELFKLLMGE